MIEEFRKYLKINKTRLDDEVAEQPSLFFTVCEAYTQAVAKRDALKEALGMADAKLDLKVRAKNSKLTEAAVKSRILLEQGHQDAHEEYALAKFEADQLGVLKEAFSQRSYMLRDLAQLFVANYFESSSVQGTNATDRLAYQRNKELIAKRYKK